jgi:hypothetical protein
MRSATSPPLACEPLGFFSGLVLPSIVVTVPSPLSFTIIPTWSTFSPPGKSKKTISPGCGFSVAMLNQVPKPWNPALPAGVYIQLGIFILAFVAHQLTK